MRCCTTPIAPLQIFLNIVASERCEYAAKKSHDDALRGTIRSATMMSSSVARSSSLVIFGVLKDPPCRNFARRFFPRSRG